MSDISLKNENKDLDLDFGEKLKLKPHISGTNEMESREILEDDSREILEDDSREILEDDSREILEDESREILEDDSREILEENTGTCGINLKEEFDRLKCSDETLYSKECNKFMLKKELIENKCLEEKSEENSSLYPNLNDTNFNIKIAEKKEFNDTKYDGTIHTNIKEYENKTTEEYANMLAKADFELQPHQAFVKNFLSFQTPYNSLLLYHGLGSGKTCSAIGVCEEMRDYLKQLGLSKRTIIVASENVQDNFKTQLFDERKLEEVEGLWTIKGCVGNKLLKEVNPMNMKGIPKDKIISQIKSLINSNYLFLGYGQFANYILKTIDYNEEDEKQKRTKIIAESKREKSKIQTIKEKMVDVPIQINKSIIRKLKNEFDGRLIVIDEVHNIRKTEDNENKKVAINLEILVKAAENMRLLLLSATPMYNSYKEIIWLLNLMNTNDRRARIEVKDVFDKNGDFKENGKELLIRKATGYISFVRGENPYTFPYRVFPSDFAKEYTFPAYPYPSFQMNGKKIDEENKSRIISLYLNKLENCGNCGDCQACAYRYIIYNLKHKSFSITTKTGQVREMPNFENMESFGYTLLQTPLESLIISYPHDDLKVIIKDLPKEAPSREPEEEFIENQEDNDDTPSSLIEEVKEAIDETKSSPDLDEGEKEELVNDTISVDTPKIKKVAKRAKERLHILEPRSLTGREGLERIMDFVDTKSPPEKGSFSYKSNEPNKRIFSRDIIGKYSSKIKTILDSIYIPETSSNTGEEVISDGIILIYSQYIDSGLIPMALALEELGFTRYGKNIKSLFETPPVDIVDVRTMKPPLNRKDFIPARYSMITGDPRLSPDNDFEVKGLTNLDNKDGYKVKVVLISKAGSEGIDFKYIRQIHILEPWYNMNRIEQIIGRGVRNLSHKDLEFIKRNVQIFMYGTLLENSDEECADLYVYRVAEYKAIQIGQVSRVLKESAVDCIINHDQTNFTQEIMSENIKEKIVQQLSNSFVINDFKIGDAPNSAACDYMDKCNYDCVPNKEIDEDNLNEDTYNEQFITSNSDKILQKIRMLMKESFFYKKDVLFQLIQTPKKYPLVQIYSALTQLIDDNSEFIMDKYGRNGRLINIEEYYLFQPLEIKDKNISVYERSVPIDFKNTSIDFELNKAKTKKLAPLEKAGEFKEDLELVPGGKILIDKLKINFNLAVEYSKGELKVPRGDKGDDSWYKYCGIVMNKMALEFIENKDPDFKIEFMIEFLIQHIIETLLFDEKLTFLNYLYSLETIKPKTFEWYSKEYFTMQSIITKKIHAIILFDLSKRMIMKLDKNNIWIESEPEDWREIAVSKTAKDMLVFDKEKYSNIIGFIGFEKSNTYLVFKTRDYETSKKKKNDEESKFVTGARCDEEGKEKTMQKINRILGMERFTKENTQLQKKDGLVLKEAISHNELCVYKEFLLRYYSKINKKGLHWFLTPEMALYHQVYKIYEKK
jgi:hypothetical protein